MNLQSQAPELVPAGKEVAPLVEEKQIDPHQFHPTPYYNATKPAQILQRLDKLRILGLRPITFWLVLLLSILLVAGAIGGGNVVSYVLKSSSKSSSKYDSLDLILLAD